MSCEVKLIQEGRQAYLFRGNFVVYSRGMKECTWEYGKESLRVPEMYIKAPIFVILYARGKTRVSLTQ